MSKRGKVLHRQTFQNSNNIVELTVKTIPKDIVQEHKSSCTQPPFVRDCALKKELQKVADEKNNNINVERNYFKKPTAQAKHKSAGGRVTVEVVKKSSRRQHKIVPKDNTWEDVLRNCSTITSFDESDVREHVSGARKEELLVNKRILSHGRTWHQKTSQTPDTEPSNTPELIVNQRIQSGETSPQEFRPRRANVDVREQNSNHEDRRRLRVSSPRGHRGSSQLNVNDAQGTMSRERPDQPLEQSKQMKGPGTNRLLSDDVNASPFGESALQLLHQLRQRLQSKGDNEGMDIVGVVEAFIIGQGSMGGVGASNIPQSASTVSPVCMTVFPTPAESIPLSSHIPNHGQQTRPKQYRYMQNQFSYGPPTQLVPPDHSPTEYQPQSQPPSHSCNSQGNYQHNQMYSRPDQDTRQHQEQIQQQNDDILKKEIARQQEIIAEQESDLLQLRTLSSRLISQQEQLVLQAQEAAKDRDNASRNGLQSNAKAVSIVTQTRECQTDECLVEEPTRDRDSGTPSSMLSDRDYRSTLLLLKTENETLRREVRGHRDLIMNLENQLTKAYIELDSERRSRSGLSSSRLSGSAPNLDLAGRHIMEVVPEKFVPSKPLSNHGESEVDSAYEEKTSSRLTSKVGSPHLDKQEGQDSGAGTSGTSLLPPYPKDTVPKIQHLNVTDSRYNMGHLTQNVDDRPSRETIVPSITRNVTLSSDQLPVSQSTFPSLELCNINSNSQGSSSSRLYYQPSNNQRAPCVETAAASNKPTTSTAKINDFNSDIGLLVSDIDLKQGKVIDNPAFPSFSTVSEESHPEEATNRGGSFLQGIPLPSFILGTNVVARNMDLNKYVINSASEIQSPTMESTRVQEKTPPQADSRSSMEPSFAPMKDSKTFTSTILSNVDELQ